VVIESKQPELDVKEIRVLEDAKVLQGQARQNTQQLRTLVRDLDAETPESLLGGTRVLVAELTRQLDEATEAEIPVIRASLQEQEALLHGLEDPTKAPEAFLGWQQRVSEEIRRRRRRQGYLIQRRNHLDEQEQRRAREETEKEQLETPRRLWGTTLARRKDELVSHAQDVLNQAREAFRRTPEMDRVQRASLYALTRDLEAAVLLLGRVPAVRNPPDETR
jgi:hypothetical protein